MTDEIKDELDRAFLDVAKTAARRTLALIDQGKIPGYQRCTGYEDGNPARRDMGSLKGQPPNLLTTEGVDSLIGRGLSALAGHDQWLDDESWMVYIGAALGLIPQGLRDWKALIYESPVICELLHDILLTLVHRRVLVSNLISGDKVYRLPHPLERWQVELPDSAVKGVRRLLIGEELMQNVERDGFFYCWAGLHGRRMTKAEPAYPVTPHAPWSRLSIPKAREQVIDQLTTGPNSVPRAMLDGPLKQVDPEAKAAFDASVTQLILSLKACFVGSDTPDPTIEQMAEAVRGLPLGERPSQPTQKLLEIGSPYSLDRQLEQEEQNAQEARDVSHFPLQVAPAGCPGQLVDVCAVDLLGRRFYLRRADDQFHGCEWVLRVGQLVIMAWQVSSTAGGRSWNFNYVYHEEEALKRIGSRNPMAVPSNRGDLLVVVRPVSEDDEDDDLPGLVE